MNGFTFFANYFDLLDNIPEEDKKVLAIAILDYMFKDIEPQLEGLNKAIFNTIRFGLDKSKSQGKRSRAETEEKPEENQTKSEQKPSEDPEGSTCLSLSLSPSISKSLEVGGMGGETFSHIVEEWNEIGLAKVKTLSKTRKSKVALRVKELGEDAVIEAIRKIPLSKFLIGNNKQGWKCSFDWLFINDSNLVKVLEGNYDNRDAVEEISNPFLQSLADDARKSQGGRI